MTPADTLYGLFDREWEYWMKEFPLWASSLGDRRYISWPGQSLAYKIGELKIRDLRRRAENELGTQFDLKAFHERILNLGAVPLDMLERHIMEWTKRESS
jgi:hypothetical protein